MLLVRKGDHRLINGNPRPVGRGLLFDLDITGLTAHLGLEFGREVIRTFEIQSIGNLLDAELGGGEQLLGAQQAKLLLISGRGETCILLE